MVSGALGMGTDVTAHRIMAHVSEFFKVSSRTAVSTARLTGGGTSFGSRAQKICACQRDLGQR